MANRQGTHHEQSSTVNQLLSGKSYSQAEIILMEVHKDVISGNIDCLEQGIHIGYESLCKIKHPVYSIYYM